MGMEKPKRPRDGNKLAKMIVDIATGEHADILPKSDKNPQAVSSGRLGGLKGGKVRNERLTQEQKTKIALDAARARWEKAKKD